MIIVDTGAWVGLANKRDQFHEICKRFFRENQEPLVTTHPVLVETVHLLFQRVGVNMALAFLGTIYRQGIHVHQASEEDLDRELTLMLRLCCSRNHSVMVALSQQTSGISTHIGGRIINRLRIS